MRALTCLLFVCAGVAYTGVALAEPSDAEADKAYQRALRLDASGDYEQALVVAHRGLASAPNHRGLLGLKGKVLLQLRDYPEACAAYEAYLATGVKGPDQRRAKKIAEDVCKAKSTFLDITLANGPAEIYLDSKTKGIFCTAAPSCQKGVLPGDYRAIAERDGFERWTGRVTVQSHQTAKLTITLVEKPSLLTVRATPDGARVTVDGAAYDAPTTIAAGTHHVVVSLAGHGEARREVAARRGQPVALDVALTPVVAIRVEPPDARLTLDGQPVTLDRGGLALSPGPHVLVARAQGFHDRRVAIPAERGPDYQLVVELARVEVAAVPPTSRPLTTRRKFALGVAGAELIPLAVGVELGLKARKFDRDAYDLCPSPSIPCRDAKAAGDLNRRARSRALQANIAFGVAGGAAIAAAILWFTGAPESRVAVTPRVDTVAGLDLAVRF